MPNIEGTLDCKSYYYRYHYYHYHYYYYHYYYDIQVYFNQTQYNFSANFNASPGTKLGTAWITMPLSLISLENESFAPLQLLDIDKYDTDLLLNSDFAPWPIRDFDTMDIDFYFDGEQLNVEEAQSDSKSLNVTQNNVDFCEDEHILIPIDVYTHSKFVGIGTFNFLSCIELSINSERFIRLFALVSVNVSSGEDV